MDTAGEVTSGAILDAINEGVYVTDTSRRIIYWSKAAERITHWPASEIVGKHCYDDVLCHEDKDGHPLCGQEYCPLHRAMVTGSSSSLPIMVFARSKKGGRVPLQVSVSPLVDTTGQVIGGVENFRDLSRELADINRAGKIQRLALTHDFPVDPRIAFTAHYIPHDTIGGDYYAVAALDENRYGFLLADVMGHGVPAALYTMFLSSLWQSQHHLLAEPTDFARVFNDHLRVLIQEAEPFAVALCGVVDIKLGLLRMVGAGNPGPLIYRADGKCESYEEVSGTPLGLLSGSTYEETSVRVGSGDRILLFTDGAVEVTGAHDELLGTSGLMGLLRESCYPRSGFSFAEVETRMLAWSNRIRFDDDITFIEIHLA